MIPTAYVTPLEVGTHQKREPLGDLAVVDAGRMGVRSSTSFAISVSLFC